MDILTFLSSIATLWFIFGSGAFIILLIIFVEHEYAIRSGITVAAYIAFLQFLIKIDVIGSIAQHPLKSIIIALIYLFIGFIWSIIKWAIYVNKKALAYKEKRYEFLTDKRRISRVMELYNLGDKNDITLDTQIHRDLMDEWKRNESILVSIPVVHENKNKISHWLIYWPASMIWSLLNDFIRNAVNMIVLKVRFIYEAITKNAYKGIEKIN